MREFGFELALCAHIEADDRIVARQLGGHVEGRRILDTVVVDPGPAFEDRAAVTAERIPTPLVESDLGPGRAREPTTVFERYHDDRARDLIERGIEVGFLERAGPDTVRQTTRYPDDWFDRIVAVENKPDLDRPGDLRAQLRTDVSLALADEVVLATSDYVTGAHLNRIPEAVGVWRFDPERGDREVVREPTPLDTDAPGIEPLERRSGRTDVAVVDAEAKRRARRRLAERAYAKGWRTFEWPGCTECVPGDGPTETPLPFCRWAGRVVDPARECGTDCPGYHPGDPPSVDSEAERAGRTAWESDPEGRRRTQVGLDRFG